LFFFDGLSNAGGSVFLRKSLSDNIAGTARTISHNKPNGNSGTLAGVVVLIVVVTAD
jgi:hypothetical protein